MLNPNIWHPKLTVWQRYLLAAAIFLLALILRFIAMPLESGPAFITFYPAIILSFYLCGTLPGVMVILLSAAAADYIFLPRFWTFRLNTDKAFAMGIFMVSSAFIGILVGRLRTYLRRLDELFTYSPAGMVAVNPANGRIVKVNPAFLGMLGYTSGEVLDKTMEEFTFPEDMAKSITYNNKLYSGEIKDLHFEKRYRKKNGDHVIAEVQASCLTDGMGRPSLVIGNFVDITERKMAEHKVQELNRDFTTFLENTTDYVYFKDKANRFRFCSQPLAEITGLSSWRDLVGKSMFELFPPEAAETYYDSELSTLREGIPLLDKLEHLYDQRGRKGWISTSKWPQFDAQDNIVGLFGISRDITEFKRFQDELTASEARYRAVVENQTELICRWKPDGTIVYANEAFRRYFGRALDGLIGEIWQPIALEADLPRIMEQLDALTPDNPVVTIENRVVLADGEIRWGQFVNRAFFDETGTLFEMQSVGRDISERKQLEEKLADSLREVEDLYNNAPCGYHSLDEDGRILRINDTELHWLGRARQEVFGRKFTDFTTPAGLELFRKMQPEFLRIGHIENLEFDLLDKNGGVRKVSVSATAIRGPDGRYLRSRSVVYNITALKETESRLKQLSAEQQAMLDSDLIGIAKFRNLEIVWHNRAFDRIFGYNPGELDNVKSRILYPNDDDFYAVRFTAYPVLLEEGVFRTQQQMRRKDGCLFWADICGTQLPGVNRDSIWMFADITLEREHRQRVESIAYHDILTGLPNRLLITDRLTQALAQAIRSEHMLAVCYMDLDGFKPVNDTFGHDVGDKLLIEISRRMELSVRANDSVGRLGGDEFVLLLCELEDAQEYQGVLQRVLTAINQPIVIHGPMQVNIGASIGVALFPTDGLEPDQLLRRADQAMYQAKQSGHNRICLYQPEMSDPRQRNTV